MIDAANLHRARTVEDIYIPATDSDPLASDRDLGTKVGDQVLSSDKETLFPLRACLGYDVTQTLFVGEHSLLVEGPSDYLYLRWFSELLRQTDRTSLDSRWTITPCGGLDKIASFVALFGAQDLDLVALGSVGKPHVTSSSDNVG